VKPVAIILFPHDDHCRVFAVGDGASTLRAESVATSSPTDAAPRIADALRTLGRRDEPVLLAVPTAWCLAARISLDGLPRRDRRAMLYRLEEKLPLAAEDVVADFIIDRDGHHALGVAARLDRLRPWVDALESAGVAIASISPAALLAAEAMGGATTADQTLLIDEPVDHVSIVHRTIAGQTAWAVTPATAEDVAMQLQVLEMQIRADGSASGTRTLVCSAGVDPMRLDLAADAQKQKTTAEQNASVSAAYTLRGRRAPAIELRRDALAPSDPLRQVRRPLNAAVAAAAALLLAVAAASLVRGWRYDRAADSFDAQLADEFTRAFPGAAVPPDVRFFVESEHRKLAAGVGSADVPPQMRRSASATMAQVLAAVVKDPKIALDRMTFNDGGFELRGRVESAAAVDELAGRLRATGFDVAPPQSSRDPDGLWSVALQGTVRQAQSVASGG
jgi:type II secretion system protein L